MEQLYLFLATFMHYKIQPIFIFDGKSPPEKMALIRRRYTEKKEAESKYDEIQKDLLALDKNSKEYATACEKLEELRKKMVKLRHEHIVQAKDLIAAFGFEYYEAAGESDQLCAYMVQTHTAWACLSEDMDMFLLNCPRVLRSISLMNQQWVLYDTSSILRDLNMNLEDLIDITILSGSTDYSKKMDKRKSIINIFDIYKNEYLSVGTLSKTFYEWYCEKYGGDYDIESMRTMFKISIMNNDGICENKMTMCINKIKEIMIHHGFIFMNV
jgi:5'-3' exonuclease